MARKRTMLEIQMGLEQPTALNCTEIWQSIIMALGVVGIFYLIALAFHAYGG